ncbi:MAG: hypothetical protein K9H64_12405 [Bacteroidales bacterium]|nr:hypothetical protein [Bacteroidales bacterium]MCF8456846.1 hypothetical protein [Bacteroidales bacterium]
MELVGNSRYAKKEHKKNFRVVAIEITNLTDSPLIFSPDIKVLLSGNEVALLDPYLVKSKIRQLVPIYLLYLPLSLYGNTNGEHNFQPFIFPIGIPISIINLSVSGFANKNFKDELIEYDLTKAVLNPHKKVYGILCFYGSDNSPITFSIRGSECGEDYFLSKKQMKNSSLSEENIYFNPSDNDYASYVLRFEELLKNDPNVISYKYIEKSSYSGRIKYRGFKANHRYGNELNSTFRIGTWQYFDRNGNLEETIDYDFNDNPVKVTKN